MRSEPHVAFVTDALLGIGGAEKTLFAALEIFPKADVFTLVYNKAAFAATPVANTRVFTSSLNNLPLARSHHKLFLPLMPGAIEQFDLSGYDVAVSFNYAVANGVKAADVRHLSYTHTPMRYAWRDLNIRGKKHGNNPIVNHYLETFRNWDRTAAQRILAFAAVSSDIAGQIQAYYQRDSQVIYPPVETERFRPSEQRAEYYAVVSRLVAHKRIDLIVDAFSVMGLPLKIIGDGPERRSLMSRAGGNVEFLGFQSDASVAEALNQARGVVCAAEEDFGIAMVEAQAAGCPVIAYGRGGVLETVVDGWTGLFFPQQSVDCVIESVSALERRPSMFNSRDIADHARRFDKAVFQRDFQRFVMEMTVPASLYQAASLPVSSLA